MFLSWRSGWFGLKWNDDCCSWLMMFAQILFNNKATHTDSLRYLCGLHLIQTFFCREIVEFVSWRSGWNRGKKKKRSGQRQPALCKCRLRVDLLRQSQIWACWWCKCVSGLGGATEGRDLISLNLFGCEAKASCLSDLNISQELTSICAKYGSYCSGITHLSTEP